MGSEYQVALPCKPGDDYWWINTNTLEIHHEKGGVEGVVIHQDKRVEILDRDGERYMIGTPWCCLSIEEAEAIRNELIK